MSTGGHQSSDTLIAQLLATCLEHRENGIDPIPFEEVCRDHPELINEVRSAAKFAQGMPRIQAVSATGDVQLKKLLGGRYRIDRRLGLGAMGAVFEATDLDLARRVAVKVVHGHFLEEAVALVRFDREAAALAAISHESVVSIFDRGVTESGAPFIVMELVEGIPCSDLLTIARQHGLDDSTGWLLEECGISGIQETSLLRQMVRWAANLASGLQAAHDAGVYHRDVKPSNIMIRRDGRAVLLDFGIASREDDETLTRAESAVGTPAYMPPEALLRGEGGAKPSQDVYGLSATLYHLLTLQAPYVGTPKQILTALSVREPEQATRVRPGLPVDAQAILDHGLARSPKGRYASPAAMEKDLRALLSFQPVSVRPTTRMTRAIRTLRRSKVALGAALSALLIGGVLGFNEVRERRAEARSDAYSPVYAQVPANLGIVGPANRVIADEELRAGVLTVLDELVETGHDQTTARALRASFFLDHGQVPAAKEDMRAAAATVATDYARELSQRYDALPNESRSALDLNLEDLPAPSTPLDQYLAGFHAMRTNRYGEAIELLADPGLQQVRHARELSLLLRSIEIGRLKRKGLREEQYAAAHELFLMAVRLEEEFGSVSAMSAHLRGMAAGSEDRYGDMLAACEEGFALSPASHVLAYNAAESARQRMDVNKTRRYAEAGLRVLPGYIKLQRELWKIECFEGNFEAAYRLIDNADFGSVRNPSADKNRALAEVRILESVEFLDADSERSKRAAEHALKAIGELPDSSKSKTHLAAYAAALLEADKHRLLEALASRLEGDPFWVSLVRLLIQVLPPDLNPTDYASLKTWLQSVDQLLSRYGSGVPF